MLHDCCKNEACATYGVNPTPGSQIQITVDETDPFFLVDREIIRVLCAPQSWVREAVDGAQGRFGAVFAGHVCTEPGVELVTCADPDHGCRFEMPLVNPGMRQKIQLRMRQLAELLLRHADIPAQVPAAADGNRRGGVIDDFRRGRQIGGPGRSMVTRPVDVTMAAAAAMGENERKRISCLPLRGGEAASIKTGIRRGVMRRVA